MLQLRETRIARSNFGLVPNGVLIPEEGIPLVYTKVDGTTYVVPATGAAGEMFAGVSYSRNTPPYTAPMFEELAVDASGSATLVRAPIAGQVFVKSNGSALTIVAGAPANVSECQVVGSKVITKLAKDVLIDVQYMYTPTVLEAKTIIGDHVVGGLPSDTMGTIGVLKTATIGTNMFDASVDWSDALHVKLGNGVFTVGTAADNIPNCVVQNAPNVNNPFLVLNVLAA